MATLSLARRFNNFYLGEVSAEEGATTPLIIDGHRVGLLRQSILPHLKPPLFNKYSNLVELNPKLNYEERTKQVDDLLREWKKRDLFIALRGWREESFEVRSTDHNFDEPLGLMRMERAATCLFGIRQYGVSINGYVHHPSRGLCLWIGRRSGSKQTWPGCLDNFVGGGLASGFSVHETARKEGREEAGLSEDLLKGLVGVGSVSFFFSSPRGLFPNTEFIYDLELPPNWTPTNTDGEVEEFRLVEWREAYNQILSPAFKTTSCPVVLDFLIRHGVISVEGEPDLPQITELLHVPLHSIYGS